MDRSQLLPFEGMTYSDDFDCADYVVHVQKELFGREVHVPGARPRGKYAHQQLHGAAQQYATPTDTPVEGDLVLMYDLQDSDTPSHAGVYVMLGGEPHVMHNAYRTGGSVTHCLRNLAKFGITVEGYYKWN